MRGKGICMTNVDEDFTTRTRAAGWQKVEADPPFEWWADKAAVLNYSELKTDYQGKSKPRSKAALPPCLHALLFRPLVPVTARLCPQPSLYLRLDCELGDGQLYTHLSST